MDRLQGAGAAFYVLGIRVTQSQNTYEIPWWEAELPVIRREQDAYLRRRLPALRADHEDLISDTLLALTRQIRRHSSGLPASWFQGNSPASEAERSHLHKLAMVILKRRIADLFRKRAFLPIISATGERPLEVVDTTAAPERKIMLTKVLEVTLSILDKMKPEDRDLIALISEDADFRKALNDRDRQRLHRVRKRLRDEIALRLGADVAELLRINP